MKLKYLAMAVPVLLGAGLLGVVSNVEPPPRDPSKVEIKVLNISDVKLSEIARSTLYYVFDGAKKEITFCLYGSVNENINGRKINVDDVKIPFIYGNGTGGIRFDKRYCDMRRYFGMAHNHFEDCLPSPIDIYRFKTDPRADIELIVCGTGSRNKEMTMSTFLADVKH